MNQRLLKISSALALTTIVVACGGGGGSSGSNAITGTVATSSGSSNTSSSSTSTSTSTPANTVASSTLQASSLYAQQCDATNPMASAAQKTGSLSIEKQWMRSYFDEAYLWFDQVPTVNASLAAYSGAMTTLSSRNVPQPLYNYFQALKTPQLTPTGNLVDQFSFAYSTADFNALSQSGRSAGFGAQFGLSAVTPPRKAVVLFTEPGSPAAAANIPRGAQILKINGIDLVNDNTPAGIAVLNAGLFPALGSTHQFVIQDSATSAPRTLSLTAQYVTSTPVQNVKTITAGTSTIGYILFNSHIASSEQLLINAFNQLKSANVSDLVLDLRYNGGGYLFIAAELAYMIAGPERTSSNGQSAVFEKSTYNSKRSAETNSAESLTPFYNVSCVLNSSGNCSSRAALPTLGLKRIYVLTQSGSCSASEAVINGLRGVDVDVKIIGGTTCGKPYGFTQKDNCGVSYFPIEFKGANAKGFGDYADGFAPNCRVLDDTTKALGDPSEGQLAAALNLRATGLCPGGVAPSTKLTGLVQASNEKLRSVEPELTLIREPLLENRWMLPRKP